MAEPKQDIEGMEREHAEQLARAHLALAEAQDRSYWLERWGIDLNQLMLRPGAHRIRVALRAVREVRRGAIAVRRYGNARLGDLRRSSHEDEISVAATEARGSVSESAAGGSNGTAPQA